MKLLSKIKNAARTGLVLGVVAAAVVGVGLVATHSTRVEAATSCDKVNIIYCGFSGTTTKAQIASFQKDYDTNVSGHAASPTVQHDYHDIRTIFNYVGADKNLVDNMNTSNTVAGFVHRNGDVTVNGKVIATNAKVAARFSVPGAVAIPGTNAYLRTTTSSFAYEQEPAIIRLDSDGNMIFAAITTCGNAVKATPKVTPKPAYTINKEVAVKGSTSFAKNVNVKPGTHVIYRITVNSTGNTAVTNLNVNDNLPAHVKYVDSTLTRDGSAANATKFFGNGVNIASLKNGSSTVFRFEAIVGPNDTPEVCTNETLNNQGVMTADKLPKKDSNATVTKKCLPKPVYACNSLTGTKVSRTVFNFTAKASASNGATISGYNFNFGDGTTKSVATASASTVQKHTYGAPGTYNATVSVTVKVPGAGEKTVTSAACATTVTVKEAPAAECTDLKLIQDTSNPRQVSATVTYNVSNGAELTKVSFNWDDGNTTNNGVKTTADHTYSKDGDFNVVATLSFSAGSSSLEDSTCQAPVTITTVMPTCDNLTIDVNNDDKSVTVTALNVTAGNGTYNTTSLNWGDNSDVLVMTDITGQSHTYASDGPFTIVATPNFTVNGADVAVTSDACQKQVSFTETPTPPETPTTLVNTGAGSVAGIFAAFSAIGAIGYRFFLNRRFGSES